MGKIEGSLGRDGMKSAVVAGGAAGNHTVTGIKTRDSLRSVMFHDGAGAITDVTAEYSISAADTINNTGGTTSAGGKLEVLYISAN